VSICLDNLWKNSMLTRNFRYNDVVKQGDQLITKLQKYGQVVRLRGSERS
jgi:hypothetical protein